MRRLVARGGSLAAVARHGRHRGFRFLAVLMVDMMATRRVAVLVDVGSGVTVWLARVSDGQTFHRSRVSRVGIGHHRTDRAIQGLGLSTALNIYPANKFGYM